ncbi:hypothetical protein D9757_005156 [Collybiopsis confluens]|uniref:Uncharacterized protein n=1 Tax=Collybiopsis confluens TaxID=2823264 RepID=A0A8H5MCH9_9AGAR|nr:hypothetical protein D9757_005156 [Collybiopsis confluens]
MPKRLYLIIIIIQLFNHFLTLLEFHPAFLIIWLPLSVWASLWRLRPHLTRTPPSSLPVHNSETIIIIDDSELPKGHLVVAIFLSAWLTMGHFFTIIESNLVIESNFASSWFLRALATLLLIVSFAQYLDRSAVPRTCWGYFYVLYRVVAFIFDSVYAIIWVIDLFQGRIELVRRREE